MNAIHQRPPPPLLGFCWQHEGPASGGTVTSQSTYCTYCIDLCLGVKVPKGYEYRHGIIRLFGFCWQYEGARPVGLSCHRVLIVRAMPRRWSTTVLLSPDRDRIQLSMLLHTDTEASCHVASCVHKSLERQINVTKDKKCSYRPDCVINEQKRCDEPLFTAPHSALRDTTPLFDSVREPFVFVSVFFKGSRSLRFL